jgi:hypothetical protein
MCAIICPPSCTYVNNFHKLSANEVVKLMNSPIIQMLFSTVLSFNPALNLAYHIICCLLVSSRIFYFNLIILSKFSKTDVKHIYETVFLKKVPI